MNVYIPRLGDIITLAEDWTCLIRNDQRNAGMFLKSNKRAGWSDPDTYGDQVLSDENVPVEEEMFDIRWYKGAGHIDKETGKFISTLELVIEDPKTFIEKRFHNKIFVSQEVIGMGTGENSDHKLYRVNYLQRIPYPDTTFSFPAGTKFKVDRIYIRKGKGFEDFDSMTFIVQNGPKAKARFWASLDDVNHMVLESGAPQFQIKVG